MILAVMCLTLTCLVNWNIRVIRKKEKYHWNEGISRESGKPWEIHSVGPKDNRVYQDKMGNYITITCRSVDGGCENKKE